MSETQEEKKARWRQEDERARYGAKTGNPFATLCDNCYGRHLSPRGAECPYPTFTLPEKIIRLHSRQ